MSESKKVEHESGPGTKVGTGGCSIPGSRKSMCKCPVAEIA